jgi:hypothetical protein
MQPTYIETKEKEREYPKQTRRKSNTIVHIILILKCIGLSKDLPTIARPLQSATGAHQVKLGYAGSTDMGGILINREANP